MTEKQERQLVNGLYHLSQAVYFLTKKNPVNTLYQGTICAERARGEFLDIWREMVINDEEKRYF